MKNYLHFSVVKKDLGRFAPVWGLYTVFLLIALVLMWEGVRSGAMLMNYTASLMASMGVINFFYALICALALFGDLYSTRLCYALHSMPLPREGWLLSHVVSGLLFCAIPTVTCTLVAAVMLGSYAYGAFLWLALTVLEFLFFFGAAVVSAMCAGTRLGAAAVYALINYLSVILVWFVKSLCEPLLFGVTIHTEKFAILCPVTKLSNIQFIITEYDNMQSLTVLKSIPAAGWWYAAIAASLGLLFLALSVVLYKKRPMETAGDMISVKFLRPVLTAVGALLVGVVLYLIGDGISPIGEYMLLGVGLAIGFFVCRMLVEKHIKVFRAKNFLGFGVLILSVAAVLFTVKLDPVGITRYVPEKDQVACVIVSPYSTQYSLRQQSCTLTDSADVEIILQMHQDAIENPYQGGVDYLPVNLGYRLKDGRTVNRYYYLPETLGYRPVLDSFYSRTECVMQGLDPETVLKGLTSLDVYSYNEEEFSNIYMVAADDPYYERGDKENPYRIQLETPIGEDPFAQALIKAIYADCEAGKMSQWLNERETVGHISLNLQVYGSFQSLEIDFYEDSENILSVLKAEN